MGPRKYSVNRRLRIPVLEEIRRKRKKSVLLGSSVMQVSRPNLFGVRNQFHGGQFSMGRGVQVIWGWFKRVT